MKTPANRINRNFATLMAAILISSGMAMSGCEKADSKLASATPDACTLKFNLLEKDVSVRDSIIDELITAFDRVDANLEIIRDKEAKVRDLAEGEEASGDRKDRIVRDIQVINTLMAENRKEISKMRTRLKNAGVEVKTLEARLAAMEAAGVEKDEQMESLRLTLAERETAMQGMHDTLTQKEMYLALQETVIDRQKVLIEEQDEEINTAYFATGSYQELKDRGLVEKKGALLGLVGGKKTFTAAATDSEFVRIDQREHTSIPVFAKKAELVTTHPAGSYKLNVNDKGDVNTIEITNPEAFWESCRYLVVATN